MTDNSTDVRSLQTTLEDHELAVKRSLESLGGLQTELNRVASNTDNERIKAKLGELGRCIEDHETHLESVVETLDEHKAVIRESEPSDTSALAEAMERARHRARIESEPSADDENS